MVSGLLLGPSARAVWDQWWINSWWSSHYLICIINFPAAPNGTAKDWSFMASGRNNASLECTKERAERWIRRWFEKCDRENSRTRWMDHARFCLFSLTGKTNQNMNNGQGEASCFSPSGWKIVEYFARSWKIRSTSVIRSSLHDTENLNPSCHEG